MRDERQRRALLPARRRAGRWAGPSMGVVAVEGLVAAEWRRAIVRRGSEVQGDGVLRHAT